jgi:hypothetical protein
LNEDLPTACLLEILGDRWQKIFESFFQQIFHGQFEELRKTTARLAPTTRLEQALELYRSSFGIKSSIYAQFDIWNPVVKIQESDIWDDPASIEDKVKSRIRLEDLLTRWVNRDGNSVFGRRAKLEESYRDLSEINGYGNGAQDTELDSMETALAQVNAELRLAQAAYPDKPFYILKADLKDYYPTLPHTLILELLALFGLDKTQLDFFQKYLQITIKDGPSGRTAQRGVPNHRRLADLLGELVMLLLDQFVKSSANIQIIRLIDDICILAASEEEAVKAWQALEEFCQQTGLRLNLEKCGAVCVGGSLPAALPNRPPVWSILTLNGQGEWQVDQARFENYLEQSRQQVLQAESIVTKSEMFNNNLNYLVKALGLRVKLGTSHRQSVNQALVYFQNSFFGADRGVAEEFRRLIRERFLDQGATLQLPDGWLHWPITAGGMSLNQALVLAWSYTKTFNRHANPQVPDDRTSEWLRRSNYWYLYYNRLLSNLEPDGPEPNQVMETLVKDFIERGSEISVEGQFGLGTYWRWILYIYGPQILDRLGTFRYLFTNLVPAQLITSKFRQGFEKESESDISF